MPKKMMSPAKNEEQHFFFLSNVHPNHVDPHMHFENPIDNWLLKNKFSALFSNFSFCFRRYDQQNTLTIWCFFKSETTVLC